MQHGYLIMEVDVDEVMPKGVYKMAYQALDGYADEEGMDQDSRDALHRRYRDAYVEAFGDLEGGTPPAGFELRFEHPDMSIDIQITEVEVYL